MFGSTFVFHCENYKAGQIDFVFETMQLVICCQLQTINEYAEFYSQVFMSHGHMLKKSNAYFFNR